MGDLYRDVAAGRRRLADVLDGLTADQWEAPSLCTGWRVREVVVHLLSGPEVGLATFLGHMIRTRFDFDKASDRVARLDRRPPAELVAALRSHADSRFHPPGFGPEAPLTDITVHGADILVPLGLPFEVAPSTATVLLDFLVTPKGRFGFGAKGRLDGLALDATDVGWHHGAGALVAGPAASLILAMCGRAVGLEGLEGDGVAELRSRLG